MRLASFSSVLALCVCLLGNGCSKGITRSTVATVLFVKGNVVFGDAERNDFQPMTSKSKIHAGDTVRTADGASINLALIPGAFVQLSGNSEIKIEDLRLTKDGNETAGGLLDRRAWVRLSRGRIVSLFSQSDRTASEFSLTTGQIMLRPDSDCLFSVWSDGTKTRATCVRGWATAVENCCGVFLSMANSVEGADRCKCRCERANGHQNGNRRRNGIAGSSGQLAKPPRVLSLVGR